MLIRWAKFSTEGLHVVRDKTNVIVRPTCSLPSTYEARGLATSTRLPRLAKIPCLPLSDLDKSQQRKKTRFHLCMIGMTYRILPKSDDQKGYKHSTREEKIYRFRTWTLLQRECQAFMACLISASSSGYWFYWARV
ncbi:GQ67_01309T0 [Komagataella phaffii]|nr:GQ67_01309T0 [Komagataella phaffii]AOA67294.1 GQ68_00081T0 [Komagataella phaffii GS115]